MLLLLEYLNLSLMKQFSSQKSKYLTMSSSYKDRNRSGGSVACYIRNDIGYLQKHFFPKEVKHIFVEITLPKTKPLVVGIIYRPPNESNFLEIINANFDKLDTNMKELYIFDDFNIKHLPKQQVHSL